MISCDEALRHKRNGVRRLCDQEVARGKGARKRGVCSERAVLRKSISSGQTNRRCGQQTEVDCNEQLKYVIKCVRIRGQVPPELHKWENAERPRALTPLSMGGDVEDPVCGEERPCKTGEKKRSVLVSAEGGINVESKRLEGVTWPVG